MNNFKEIGSFKLPQEKWMIAPFVEPVKDEVFFTDGVLFTTPEAKEIILLVKTQPAPKIITLQAFFVIREEEGRMGFPSSFSIKEAPYNSFKCGWRSDKEEIIREYKDNFFKFIKELKF